MATRQDQWTPSRDRVRQRVDHLVREAEAQRLDELRRQLEAQALEELRAEHEREQGWLAAHEQAQRERTAGHMVIRRRPPSRDRDGRPDEVLERVEGYDSPLQRKKRGVVEPEAPATFTVPRKL